MSSSSNATRGPLTSGNHLNRPLALFLSWLLIAQLSSCWNDEEGARNSRPADDTRAAEERQNDPVEKPPPDRNVGTAASKAKQSRRQICKTLEERFRLAINLDPSLPTTGPFPISGRPAKLRAIDKYLPILESELNKLPPTLLARLGIREVSICAQLSQVGRLRAGAWKKSTGTFYFDAELGAHAPGYQARMIHHELFHLLDRTDDGKVYRDSNWSLLNEDNFNYGSGGLSNRDRNASLIYLDLRPGFLTTYSMSSIEEDKAELFSILMVKYPLVMKQSETDTVLAAKVARLREIILAFEPTMGDTFWNGVSRQAAAGARK